MKEKSNQKLKECDICGENGTSLCFKCMQYFCDSCFKLIHDKPKNAQHKKELIDPYVPIDLRCQTHPLIPLNLFCLEEKGKYFINNYIRTLLCILSL